MKTFEKTFEVPLTESELNDMGRELAEKEILVDQLSEKKKSVSKEYKSKIDSLNTEILEKSKMIESGKAPKKISCFCNLDDPEPGKKSYFRADNEELIEVQDMTPEELGDEDQMNAFHGDTGAEDQPLNYFLNIYGVDLNSIDYEGKDAFVANNPSDLEEHDIPSGEIEKVQGCLLIKSSHEAIKEVFSSAKYEQRLDTDIPSVFWYAFPQLNEIDNSYEIVEEEETEEQTAQEAVEN